jgi:hypothetical protein
MTWTAPVVDRIPPPWTGDEWTALVGWLEHHRSTLLAKCEGLTAEQLRLRSVPPSTLSLLGLVRHMADVERTWFRRRVAGEELGFLYWTDADPDADFNDVDSADPRADRRRHRRVAPSGYPLGDQRNRKGQSSR